MSLLARINLWLCGAFVCFLVVAIVFSGAMMRDQARANAVDTARLLMDSAQAARDYTTNEIVPTLAAWRAAGTPETGTGALPVDAPARRFDPQTIPAYAATRIFEALHGARPAYAYREATLNPTNPADRAVAWEADVIQHFRAHPDAEEFVSDRHSETGQSLYLAKPIRINDAQCLQCHDTPAGAPPEVVRQYGSVNGFGWKLHETVGAQIVSVPLDTARAGADKVVWIVAGFLTAVFVLMFVVVNVVVRVVVLRPIARLAVAAERISTGQPVDMNLAVAGKDEVSALSRAFDRMRTSVEKSLALLQRGA